MPKLLQPDTLDARSWADTFPSRTGSLHELFGEQSGRPNQYQSEVQLRLLDVPSYEFEEEDASGSIWTLNFSSISASPEGVRLWRSLRTHEQDVASTSRGTSILDFPRLDLGEMLLTLAPDDDLLGEMLADEARS